MPPNDAPGSSRPSASFSGRRIARPTFALALVGVLALVLIDLATTDPPEPFTEVEAEAYARYSVYLAAVAIQAYRDTARRLPATLEQLGVDAVGLTYALDGKEYVLRVSTGGDSVQYRAGDDLAPFEAAFAELDQR